MGLLQKLNYALAARIEASGEALGRACDILLITNHEVIPPPKVQGELF